MAGVILVVMGLIGFGAVIKFIPHPVVAGFTSGIALIIFTSQIRDFLGLAMNDVPAGFIEKWGAFAEASNTINIWAIVVGVGTVLLLVYWPKISHRIPGSLIAVIVSTLLVRLLDLPIDTIGSRFGMIPTMLPSPQASEITFNVIRGLVQPATTIALLVAIESLLSAVVADGMIGGRHRSNMELVAQGSANIVSALFGGMPATGAIARTATNIRNGGRTPVAGIVHALTLLLIMLFFGRWASFIPLACLAGILVVVAYNMSEWHTTVAMLKSPKSDVAVLLTTFGLTVLIDLTVAIEVGMVLAAFLFMKRMSAVTNIAVFTREMRDDEDGERGEIDKELIPPGVEIFEINGPFFFGAVYKFKEAINIVEKAPPVRVIRMSQVNAIDSSGLQALKEVAHDCRKHGTVLLISEVRAQPYVAMMKSGLVDDVGSQNVLASLEDTLSRARAIVAGQESPPLEPSRP
jgi:SulP family sulfate permease